MTDETPASDRPSPRTGTEPVEAKWSAPGAVPAVDARGLVKTFGTNRAVDGIDLVVHEGEILGVLGPNGAGKTTFVKHAIGLLKPKSGRVLVNGQDTKELSVAQIASTLGYVFQSRIDVRNLGGKRGGLRVD